LPHADTAPPIEADMTLNYSVLLVLCGPLVCGFELVKLLEGEFPALTMAAARTLLAAVVILLFCLLARQPEGERGAHKALPRQRWDQSTDRAHPEASLLTSR
jgi:hypothetical protein